MILFPMYNLPLMYVRVVRTSRGSDWSSMLWSVLVFFFARTPPRPNKGNLTMVGN